VRVPLLRRMERAPVLARLEPERRESAKRVRAASPWAPVPPGPALARALRASGPVSVQARAWLVQAWVSARAQAAQARVLRWAELPGDALNQPESRSSAASARVRVAQARERKWR
jgi:hypothetical protein